MIAQIKISEIYASANLIKRYGMDEFACELNAAVEENLRTNAHIKRGDHIFGRYVIIKGEKNESMVYERALPISQGNICLAELKEIFYKHILRRNGAKWFEALFGDDGTNSLLTFVESK